MRRIFQKFSPADFQFLADLLCEEENQKPRFLNLIQKDHESLDHLLNQNRVFKQILEKEDLFLRISPYLYFELLLRQAILDIQREAYTLETIGYKTRVPVFDQRKVLEVFSREMLRDYLVEMLASFVRINNFTVYVRKGRGVYFKKTFSDFDLDLLSEMGRRAEEPYRFFFLKRAGDVALFMSGIFPEHIFGHRDVGSSRARVGWLAKWTNRGEELEERGIFLYRQASESQVARERNLDAVLNYLAENFRFTKKPLNVMTDRYLVFRKYDIFQVLSN
ncbi:MAG: hypothetical protein N2Z84_00730 [Atribacterota bacterium]|nr:hypothetical protein [Atribacterota bacterium]